jgi:peptide/nickel transport system ATP-binding protein
MPTGCSFRPRCTLCMGRPACESQVPPLRTIERGRTVACHFAEEAEGWIAPKYSAWEPRTSTPVRPIDPEDRSEADRVTRDPSPDLQQTGRQDAARPHVLSVVGLTKRFVLRRWLSSRKGEVKAVDGVDLRITEAETLGLVGESGCGKSSVAQCIMRLLPVTAGQIVYGTTDVTNWSRRRLRSVRSHAQIVFQDPYSSLNPRMAVRDILAEPLQIRGMNGREVDQRVGSALEQVGLSRGVARRYPHQFSGGQRQRIAIARALILTPTVVVLDEPVSSLDVSAQAQIIGLLERLKKDLGLALLFISHDLSVVRHLADRVAVMYLGRIVELGTSDQVLVRPAHPYTIALLSAVPKVDAAKGGSKSRIALSGELPDPSNLPSGCRFRSRCWKAQELCAREDPMLLPGRDSGHSAACHFPEA